ncbi:hypothetical protein NPIL_362311 [Nephila pilipes]|uniref:BTB domain-containing protein n=1 Tax=Nephila pilipes TaxID=299642 RepID=A0A8X6MY94_NEPPI|nr:hypothetical protein NPIL_362311 [Nephila pilipes]
MSSDLIMSDHMSDVVLKVPHGGYSWRFSAHSAILAARSHTFREMLEERADDPVPSAMTVIGIQPDTMLQLLKYLYLNEYPTEVTADILKNSEKFGLNHLKDHLEEIALQNLTIAQACYLLEGLEIQQYLIKDCVVKDAYEAIVFGGVWRWGRRYCSQINRPLKDEIVAEIIMDMLCCIRRSSIREKDTIPEAAFNKFNGCLPKRCRYKTPEDALDYCNSWQTSGSWELLTESLPEECKSLCLQMSFDKSVMLIGITFEICAPCGTKGYLLVYRELDRKEVFRQEINCFQGSYRKLSRMSDPEHWMKAEVLLSEPLILSSGEIYSIYLKTAGKPCCLPSSSLPKKKRIGSVFATAHGQKVKAVQELYLIPDVRATWG